METPKISRWKALLSVTAKDHDDISQGKRNLCDPIPLSASPQEVHNQEKEEGFEEEREEMPNTCISMKRKRTQDIKNTPTTPIAAKKLKTGKEAITPPSSFKSRMKNHSKTPRLMMGERVQDECPSIMPEKMSESIKTKGGREIKWVCKKDVFTSDISSWRNILWLPRDVEEVLTEHQKRYLKMDRENEVEVLVVDMLGTPRLTIKYWPSIFRYVFLTQWNVFVVRHGIQANVHQLDIWSFRLPGQDDQQEKLCFAIDVRRKTDK